MEFIKEKERIYCLDTNGKIIAEITFPEVEIGVFEINHTFVDESLRGKGIAKELVKMALQEIKDKNGEVRATCSYAKEILKKEQSNFQNNDSLG